MSTFSVWLLACCGFSLEMYGFLLALGKIADGASTAARVRHWALRRLERRNSAPFRWLRRRLARHRTVAVAMASAGTSAGHLRAVKSRSFPEDAAVEAKVEWARTMIDLITDQQQRDYDALRELITTARETAVRESGALAEKSMSALSLDVARSEKRVNRAGFIFLLGAAMSGAANLVGSGLPGRLLLIPLIVVGVVGSVVVVDLSVARRSPLG